MDDLHIIYTNSKKTAMVNKVTLSDGSDVYDVYSMGSEDEIEEADIAERAVCFSCTSKDKAISLASFIAHCSV